MRRCIICKDLLKETDTTWYCAKAYCQRHLTESQNLRERISTFTTFFGGKTPTDDLYKEYFAMVKLEDVYQKHLADKHITFSRRAWFHANVLSVHAEWPDEYGRKYGSFHNDAHEE